MTRGDAVARLDAAVTDVVTAEQSVATALDVELTAWQFVYENNIGGVSSVTALDKIIKSQTVDQARGVIHERARLGKAKARAEYWQFVIEHGLWGEVPGAAD